MSIAINQDNSDSTESLASKKLNSSQRIAGLDFARFFAIVGMVMVHFRIALADPREDSMFMDIIGLFEGRAATLFVILAGLGVGLMSRNAAASGDTGLIGILRYKLLKRAGLLVVLGLSYSAIWPADILHLYGFYILLSLLMLTWRNQSLVAAMFIINIAFIVLLAVMDYEAGWDFSNLEYTDFWTLEGMIRHIFFNGFNPVFPWLSFFIFGLWLSKQALHSNSYRNKLLLVCLIGFAVIQGASYLVVDWAAASLPELSAEDRLALLGTTPMPPLPQFVISAITTSTIIICLCIKVCESVGESRVIQWISNTGRISLSLYVFHIVIALGIFEELGMLGNQSAMFAFFAAETFCLVGLIFANLWLKRFKHGPIEWVFRKLS